MGVIENAASNVANIVSKSISAVTPGAGAGQSALSIEAEKTNELLDVRIPETLSAWLTAPLKSLGFSIQQKEYKRFEKQLPRLCTLITNSVGHVLMFHIPKEILELGKNVYAVDEVIGVMRLRDETLIVVSEGLEKPHIDFKVIGPPMWLKDGIRWEFVQWGDLEQARTAPEDDQRVYLPGLLRLEELIKEAQKLPVGKITDEEIAALAKIVSEIPQFIDNGEQAWRLNLTQAGLKEIIAALPLAGTTGDVSRNVLNQLRILAPLDDFPMDKILGRFLCQILTIQDVTAVDKERIRKIVATYSLAPSFLKQ